MRYCEKISDHKIMPFQLVTFWSFVSTHDAPSYVEPTFSPLDLCSETSCKNNSKFSFSWSFQQDMTNNFKSLRWVSLAVWSI